VHAVEARSSVRDRLRAAGVDARLGGINRFSSIADVLDAERDAAAAVAPVNVGAGGDGRSGGAVAGETRGAHAYPNGR
jgi:hypothetical protein